MEQANGNPINTTTINITPLGNKVKSIKRQKIYRETSPQYFPPPPLRLHCLLCLMGVGYGAEEKKSSHTELSVRITLVLSVAFFFFTAAISIPVGLICCLEMSFA